MTFNTLKHVLQTPEKTEFSYPSMGERIGEIIQQNSKHIVVWNGSIGWKAQELLDKTSIIESFSTPECRVEVAKSVVMSLDVLSKIFWLDFEKSWDKDLRSEINNAFIDEKYFNQIWKTLTQNLHSYAPLVVRSSGKYDASGVGIYQSEFCANEQEAFLKSLKIVLKSYFSPWAQAWKKHHEAGEKFEYFSDLNTFVQTSSSEKTQEFWVLVQNIVWKENKDYYFPFFAPEISFSTYTSTSLHEKGMLSFVKWLWCGVDGEGYWVGFQDAFQANFNLPEILYNNAVLWSGHKFTEPFSTWLVFDLERKSIDSANIQIKSFIELKWFFEFLEKIEASFWVPQYLEVVYDEIKKSFVIVQIADIISKKDDLKMQLQWEKILEAKNVMGTWEIFCKKMFFLSDVSVNELKEFNQKNKNYILVVDGFFSTTKRDFLQNNFDYYSHAGAIIETFKYIKYAAISHYNWQVQATKKLFWITSLSSWEVWEFFGNKNSISWNFQVIASEKEGILLLSKI